MNEKQLSTPWQPSIGNDVGLHNPTPAASTIKRPALASPDLLSKVVLLVDSNSRTRESRARVLRTLGVTVHSAASAATARTRLANSKFDLVLVDLGRDVVGAESLVAEIRMKDRKQRVAYLVGKPLYVASSLKRDDSAAKTTELVLQNVPYDSNPSGLTDFGKRIKDAERAG